MKISTKGRYALRIMLGQDRFHEFTDRDGIIHITTDTTLLKKGSPTNTLKSRTIDISKIKDKNEKKYWSELKRVNRIPSEYLSTQEIMEDLKNFVKERKQ